MKAGAEAVPFPNLLEHSVENPAEEVKEKRK
jgi:hypothetical protein